MDYIILIYALLYNYSYLDYFLQKKMLPSVGIEPTTTRLKVLRSTD